MDATTTLETTLDIADVRAAAASLKGLHPNWTPAQIEEHLLKTSIDAGKKGRDDFYGEGLLNLLAALR